MPLVEYASFVINFSNRHDIDKLQKLQNRTLRVCYDVQNQRDRKVMDLREMAKIHTLQRKDMNLLYILYELHQNSEYEKQKEHIIGTGSRYIDIQTTQLNIYKCLHTV